MNPRVIGALCATSIAFGATALTGSLDANAAAAPRQATEEGPPPPGTRFTSTNDSVNLSTFWTQVDTRPDGSAVPPGVSRFGNVHVGNLFVYKATGESAEKRPGQRKVTTPIDEVFAFAEILDFDCPVGVLPPTGGGHGLTAAVGEEAAAKLVADAATNDAAEVALQATAEAAAVEPPAGECVHLGVRFGENDVLDITYDPKLSTAHVVGFLIMRSPGGDPHSPGPVVGRPRIDTTWTGTGEIGNGKSESTYRRGQAKYSDSGRSSDRQSVMSGILGPMGYDPNLSGGSMSVNHSESTQVVG